VDQVALVCRGVTNTYGSYAMVRTGLWSTQQFYSNLAGQIGELESRPARRWQSVEQSSLDAWLEKYPAYNRPEESISYYNKGQLVGVALDILIRDMTDNRASLDDLLRVLNDEFARRGRFYNEGEDLRAVAEGVIRGKTPGATADLKDFSHATYQGPMKFHLTTFWAAPACYSKTPANAAPRLVLRFAGKGRIRRLSATWKREARHSKQACRTATYC